jgi:hypothetical protein
MDEAEIYADPANRVPAGPPRKRTTQGRMLSGHVPVRFSPSVIARIRTLAADDGLTVSGWIRAVVEREVERRMPVEESSLPYWTPALRWEADVLPTANTAPPPLLPA